MRLSSICPALMGLTVMVGLIASPAYAQKGPNVDESASSETRSPVEQLMLAHRLYAYGVEDQDPMLVIAAARLAAGVPTKEVEREATETPEPEDGSKAPAKKSTEKGSDATPPDLAAMIAKGRELAGDQKALQAMLDDVEGTKSKGKTYGRPGRNYKYIPARTRTRYYGRSTTYDGGRRAEIGISGNGATNLDLYVYDQNGNLVCRSTRGWDRERCVWHPRWTGPFKIHVVNRGYRGNRYVIYWN